MNTTDASTIILETPHCTLRNFEESDAEQLFPILNSKEVMCYSMSGPLSFAATKALLGEWITLFRNRGFSPWAVVRNNQLIGYAGFDVRIVEDIERIQITFRLSEQYWGKGLGTEITYALKAYAIETLGLTDIIAIIDPENQASIHTIRKIGMHYEKNIIYGGLELHMYSLANVKLNN